MVTLQLGPYQLAELARVHWKSVAEAPYNTSLQRFMRDTLQILSLAGDVIGDASRAVYWFRHLPIAEFEHQTAERLVSRGDTEAVASYLRSIAGARPP